MLDAEEVPAGGILDGRVGGRMAGMVLPADTSGTCTRLGDQEDGVVLCEGSTPGSVLNGLVGAAFLAQLSGRRQYYACR